MARRSDDKQLNLPVTEVEFQKVKADADALGLSVQNYLRKRLSLDLRDAGGIRPGGFETGNQHAVKKKRKKRAG